jgi:SAM-dependent methyltransferase
MHFGSQLYQLKLPVNPRQNRFFYPIYGQIQIGGRIRFCHFTRLFQPIDPQFRLLDFGCGNGNYGFVIASEYPQSRIDSYDSDQSKFPRLRDLKGTPDNLYFLSREAFSSLPAWSYDFILCIDVLEHIEDDAGTLKHLVGLLKPEGILFIHLPKNHLKRKSVLKNTFHEKHEDHVRDEYTESKIRDLLGGIRSLKLLKLVFTFGFWGELAWEIDNLLIRHCPKIRYLLFPVLHIMAWIDARGNNRWGNGFFMVIQKITD